MPTGLAETGRLLRRAKYRPGLVLLLALALTGVVVWLAIKTKKTSTAMVILRMSDSSNNSVPTFVALGDVRSYLLTVSLSNTRLLALRAAFGLFPEYYRISPQAAIGEIRGRIGVEVSVNPFIIVRTPELAPRTVRIEVSYRDRDPALASEVVTGLAQLIVTTGTYGHLCDPGTKEVLAATAERVMQSMMGAHQQRFGSNSYVPSRLRPTLLAACRSGGPTSDSVESNVGRLSTSPTVPSEARLADPGHVSSAALRNPTYRTSVLFHVLGAVAPIKTSFTLVQSVVIAIAALVVCLPISALCVGACDGRVHFPEDLKVLGLTVLGTQPTVGQPSAGSRCRRFGRRRRPLRPSGRRHT